MEIGNYSRSWPCFLVGRGYGWEGPEGGGVSFIFVFRAVEEIVRRESRAVAVRWIPFEKKNPHRCAVMLFF